MGAARTLEYVKNKLLTKASSINSVLRRNLAERNRCLGDFEKSIPHSRAVSDDGIVGQAKEYDTIVCESDQIWNPGLWSNVMFLGIPGYTGNRFSYEEERPF